MTNRKALGRGLSALLPDVPPDSKEHSQDSIQLISVDQISPNPFQPRELFDEDKLAELAHSIAEKGLVQPITVRQYQDHYQLIAGERRLRCVRELGVDRVPAYILDVDTDEEMMELSIIENIHREDLNPIDIANGYKRLIDECRLTQEQISIKVGKDRATIANFLRLLKLPKQIQESAQRNEISMGHARSLLAVNRVADQLTLWKKIVKQNMSVRQVEAAVRKLNDKSGDTIKPLKPAKSPFLGDAENKLRTRLATNVKIKDKSKGGVIEIEYYNNDDLDRLLQIMLER